MAIASTLLRTGVLTALGAAASVWSFGASAAEFDYEANLGMGHSDNIRRAPTNEEDEDIASAGLRFSFDQRSRRLQADAVGDLAYAEYLGNTYDSEVLGNFTGNARFAFVPERIEWVVTDNFGQVLSDPFLPVTPDNRQNINYFTTGPDLTLLFGSQTRLRLGGRYSLTTYEDDPFDSDSVSGQLALIRQLSSASSVSLNARYQQVSYDETALNSDYDQSDAFVRYDVTGARTHLAIDAGYSIMERDAAADSEDGLLLRLDMARRLSSSSTATLQAGREFSNAGSAFSTSQNSGIIGQQPTPGIQTAQPFTNDFATLGYNFDRNRTGFSLSASWADRAYDDGGTLDQTLTTFGAQFSRELSQRTSLTLNGSYSLGEFEVPDSDYEDLNAGVSFGWRLSQRVTLTATYGYFDRSSDRPDGEYTENRYWLSIGYGRGMPRDTLLGPSFPVDQRI